MIAQLVFWSWPVVSVMLYRKFSLPVAVLAILLGGYLFLPQRISLDLPLLPEVNRHTMPALTALAIVWMAISKDRLSFPVLPGWLPRSPVILGLMAMFTVGVFLSIRTNGDALVYGDRVIEGMKLYDAFSILLDFAMLLVPVCLARRLFATAENQKILLLGIVVAALIYTPLVLYEVRMSPQLHMQVYGFFPHSFLQHMRGDGFRPIVFLNHGLALSLFLCASVLAAATLLRSAPEGKRLIWLCAIVLLFVTLVLSKSLGPLMIACMLLPVALFFKPRLQLLVAVCIAGMVLTYPVLRAAHLIPINQVTAFAESISPDRARSFVTRLENEEAMLAKAQERPLFGWGGWGRNRVFDEKGRNLGLTDGTWIIELGTGGWFRYIPFFGLLCWPIIGLLFARRDKVDLVSVSLALILCAKLIDLIPNSGVQVIFLLAVGALLGRLEMRSEAGAPVQQEAASEERPGSRYTRGKALGSAGSQPDGPGYVRSLPEKGSRKARAKKPGKPRETPLYSRPGPGMGYRK